MASKKASKKTARRSLRREPAVPTDVTPRAADHDPMPFEDAILLGHFGERECEQFQEKAWGHKPIQNLNELLRLMDRRTELGRRLELSGDDPGRTRLVMEFGETDAEIAYLRLICEVQLNNVLGNRNRRASSEDEIRLAETRMSFDLFKRAGVQRAIAWLNGSRSVTGRSSGHGPQVEPTPSTLSDADRQAGFDRLIAGPKGPIFRAIYEALPLSVNGENFKSAASVSSVLDQRGFGQATSTSSVRRMINQLKAVLGDEIQTQQHGGGGSWKTIDRLAGKADVNRS